MKTNSNKIGALRFLALLGVAFPLAATAYPNIRMQVNPSSIFIYATNEDGKSYTCSINMRWHYTSYGTPQPQQLSQVFSVGANAKDVLVIKMEGAWVGVQTDEAPQLSCT